MEILIDVNGGDNGIDEAIRGVLGAIGKVRSGITLVGDKDKINRCLKDNVIKNLDKIKLQIKIIDAKDVITNFDSPAKAIKTKKESSIVKAYDYMKTVENTVFVSAGSTGALMAGALLKLRRMEGIRRPALVTVLPTATGREVILLDCGANVTAAGVSLLQYAKMGILYSEQVFKTKNVKVAMLNIGTEDKKGSPDLKETYELLATYCKEFVGNIEAREILSGDVDVIVTDGLMGNIALKSIEGTAKTLTKELVSELKKNIITSMRALVIKGVLKKALSKYDYTKYGGAILLGVKKPVIKIHGNAVAKNYELAILQADKVLEIDLIGNLAREIENKE